MKAATSLWESLGSEVANNDVLWDFTASLQDIDKKANELIRQGANINYSVFAGGNHNYTWTFAYDIEAIRDWMFQMRKSPEASN